MGGWKLKPGPCVVQVVYEDEDGNERVGATAKRPVIARRFLRWLEREYPNGPPGAKTKKRRRNPKDQMHLTNRQWQVLKELACYDRLAQWDGKTPAYIIPGWHEVRVGTMELLVQWGLIYAVSDADSFGIQDYQLTEAGRERLGERETSR